MIDQLQAGSVSVTPGDWATFLYNEEDDYDAEDPAKGLFRGYVVVRVRDLRIYIHHANSFVLIRSQSIYGLLPPPLRSQKQALARARALLTPSSTG